jgi:hypothetical protein
MSIYRKFNGDYALACQAMAQWVQESLDYGYDVYYLNFMFAHLSGNKEAILDQMKNALETGFYPALCRQFSPHPAAPAERHRLPELWLCPDLPAPKRAKKSDLADMNINEGLHYNGPLRIPPVSRKKMNLADELARHKRRYAVKGIDRIHVEPIDRDPSKISDYVQKTVKRGLCSDDRIVILPRSESEIRQQMKMHLTPGERMIKDLQARYNIAPQFAGELVAGLRPLGSHIR